MGRQIIGLICFPQFYVGFALLRISYQIDRISLFSLAKISLTNYSEALTTVYSSSFLTHTALQEPVQNQGKTIPGFKNHLTFNRH